MELFLAFGAVALFGMGMGNVVGPPLVKRYFSDRRTGEAQAEIAELPKRQPEASLALFQLQGFRHKWMRELHLDGLRKAGLPET